MLKSNNVINTTNLEKEDDVDAHSHSQKKLISTDTFNNNLLTLDNLENESTSYVLGYN
jgi:hypothetical protein